MWGRNKSSGKSVKGRFDTLVSEQTEFKGDIEFNGGLHIDGKVVGSIRAPQETDAIVRISERGVVEGDITAPYVVVNGRVKGNVHSSKRVELAAKALIQGNVYYNLLEMAMGACVNGSLVPTNQEVPAKQDVPARPRVDAKAAARPAVPEPAKTAEAGSASGSAGSGLEAASGKS